MQVANVQHAALLKPASIREALRMIAGEDEEEESAGHVRGKTLPENLPAASETRDELAAEIAKHALLHEASKAVSGHFGGICAALREEISKEMLPLADSLTGRVIAELDKQLAAAVAGLEKVGGLEDSIADIRARHRRQVEIGNYDCAELADRPGCALPWIVGNFEAAV
jgi:hypothetical protein